MEKSSLNELLIQNPKLMEIWRNHALNNKCKKDLKEVKSENEKILKLNTIDIDTNKKIEFPSRGNNCTHLEVREFASLFEQVLKEPKCLICKNEMKLKDIIIDSFLLDIFAIVNTNPNLSNFNTIEINTETGNWAVK